MAVNYTSVNDLDGLLPTWQKQSIDTRLEAIAKNPERLRPIDELFSDLDKED